MPKTIKPKRTERTRISIQVKPELRAALERAATSDNRTLSGWIVNALAGAVKQGGN